MNPEEQYHPNDGPTLGGIEDLQRWRVGMGKRLDVIDAQLLENTRTTDEIKKNTDDMVDMFRSWQGAMKVFGWFSRPIIAVSTVVGGVAAAVAAVLALWPKK